MIPAGDLEHLVPVFDYYLNMLPFARARTQAYFGHGGVFFTETKTVFGAFGNVLNVTIPVSNMTREYRGRNGGSSEPQKDRCYGFVHYESTQEGEASAQAAIQAVHNTEVSGARLTCSTGPTTWTQPP